MFIFKRISSRSKEVKELKQLSFCWGCQAFVSELNIAPFCIEMYLVLTFLTAFFILHTWKVESLSLIGKCLSVPESDFPKPVVAHEPTFVHISVDSIEPAFTRVLPHFEVASVLKDGGAFSVLRYHELIAVEFAK